MLQLCIQTLLKFSPRKVSSYVRKYVDLISPIGIAIDDEGYSLASDGAGKCLCIFDPQESKIHTLGNMDYPSGIALESRDGNVYVTDEFGLAVYDSDVHQRHVHVYYLNMCTCVHVVSDR